MKITSLIFSLFSTIVLFAQQKGATPITQHSSIINQTRAVVIGISDYQDPAIPDFHYADKDAESFTNLLPSSAGSSLDGDHLKLIDD